VLLGYALGDLEHARAMLLVLVGFLAEPNVSRQYPDLGALLAAHVELMTLLVALGVSLAVAGLGHAHRGLVLAVIGWALPYLYLLIRRPHDTSVTSATFWALAALATALLAIPNRRTRQVASGIVLMLLVIALRAVSPDPELVRARWIALAPEQRETAEVLDQVRLEERRVGPHVAVSSGFLPSATFAWNGLLGMHQVVLDPGTGLPVYVRGGQTLARFFSPVVFVGDALDRVDGLKAAWDAGVPVLWLETDDTPPAPPLNAGMGNVAVDGEWRYTLGGYHYRVVLAHRGGHR
jgi:hypothetical protein